jgi:hypothetical protein
MWRRARVTYRETSLGEKIVTIVTVLLVVAVGLVVFEFAGAIVASLGTILDVLR